MSYEGGKITSLIINSINAISQCRDVPSRAALPVIRPALGRQQSVSERAKIAMQGYLNHFLGNMDIANSREVDLIMYLMSFNFYIFFVYKRYRL